LSILQSKPFVMACGSNRRDFTGAVYAAEKAGINLIIAETQTYEELNLTENTNPIMRVVSPSHPEFNVLLTHAEYVIIPARLPQVTPVGIGTIARVKMAGKIPIAVNNTGVDTMITHGVDGFLIPDPSAEHEAKFGSYQRVFEELKDESRRKQVEGKIAIMAHTDEVAGVQMARIATCLAKSTISSQGGTTTSMYELHHITNCHACGGGITTAVEEETTTTNSSSSSSWCDFWHVSDPMVGIQGTYGQVGPTLEDSCEIVKKAAIVQVVRNPDNEKMYVATACPDLNF